MAYKLTDGRHGMLIGRLELAEGVCIGQLDVAIKQGTLKFHVVEVLPTSVVMGKVKRGRGRPRKIPSLGGKKTK